MAAQTHNHSLWLMPQGVAGSRLARVIKKLSQAYGTPVFPPHVTLLTGIARPARELLMETRALASAGYLKELQLGLDGLATTDAYFRSLFVLVEPNEELLAAEECTRKCFGAEQTEIFMPHLSLLYGALAETEKSAVIARLNQRYPTCIIAHEIAVYETGGAPEAWQRIGSVTLGKA